MGPSRVALLVVALAGPLDSSRGWLFSSSGADDAVVDPGPADPDPLLAASTVRGLPVRDEHRYAGLRFSCDGGRTDLSVEAVNDDFCDCQDGADEPGTAACAGVAQSSFYCANVEYGAGGEFIASSRVGDGVCDCCDGSDENAFASSGSSAAAGDGALPCPNTCLADGKEFRIAAAKRARAEAVGREKKADYVARGAAAGDKGSVTAREAEARAELAALEADKAGLQTRVEGLEAAQEAQRLEREKLMTGQRVAALQLHRLDRAELERLVVDVARESDGGDVAARLVNELLDGDGRETVTVQVETDGSAAPEPAASGSDDLVADWLEAYDDEEGEGDPYVGGDNDGDGDGAGDSADPPQESELEAARSARDATEDKVRALQVELAELEEEKKNDYGPENEWFVLKGNCYELKADGYTYKMCPFADAKQNHIKLGAWEGFAPDSNYRTLLFKGGQRCWNGPARSLTVTVTCGAEEQLTEVEEPSMCEYVAKFSTPAAC